VSKQLFKNFFFSSSNKYSKVVVISNEVLIQVFTQKEKKSFSFFCGSQRKKLSTFKVTLFVKIEKKIF